MNIEILESSDLKLKLKISDTTPEFVNTLRRAIIEEVPTIAIDDVLIVENTSVLFDEMLAFRLGLIPFKGDTSTLVYPSECSCGGVGCSLCSIQITLNKEAVDKEVVVYSGDLEVINSDVRPVSDKIVIAKLAPGQKISLEANAVLGRGKDHVKWKPVSTVGYTYLPIVEILNPDYDDWEECVDACPVNILKHENNKLVVTEQLKCILCNECVKKCGEDVISVKSDPSTILLTINSIGSLTPEEIMKEATKILKEKFTNLKNAFTTSEDWLS